jgi:hypothetical protein
MIIDDFDLVRIPFVPDETDAPLVVDADTVLSSPFSLQRFQSVTRRHPQILKAFRAVKNKQGSRPEEIWV